MRTTLSLDDDVAAQLEQPQDRGDPSFRQLASEALSLTEGLCLATSDSGLARFPGLKWLNPLQSA